MVAVNWDPVPVVRYHTTGESKPVVVLVPSQSRSVLSLVAPRVVPLRIAEIVIALAQKLLLGVGGEGGGVGDGALLFISRVKSPTAVRKPWTAM